MEFKIVNVEIDELQQYKVDMQAAFQKGFEDKFGKSDAVILSIQDIEQSLNAKGSVAYKGNR